VDGAGESFVGERAAAAREAARHTWSWEIGSGLGQAGCVRFWSLDVWGVDGSDGVLGSDQRDPVII
jgi:hypothetical protein